MSSESADVAVLGAGAAGCAAALRLRELGHEVVLFHRPPVGRAHAIESLPDSVVPWLEQLGLRANLDAATWARPLATQVSWGPSLAAAAGPAAAARHVERQRFDAMLLQACISAGVKLRSSAVRRVQTLLRGWRVLAADGRSTEAALVVDARGRRAGHARAPATAGLGATWQLARAAEPCSQVEALADGWLWATPVDDRQMHVMVFAEAQRCAGLSAAQRLQLYRFLLRQSSALAPLLSQAACGPVSVCDATLRCAPEPLDEHGGLQVGDAAFTVDPLSSQGVASALRQGVQAAACVHTVLVRPADSAWAWAFHRSQVQRHFQRHRLIARGFYRAALDQGGGVFWAARAGPLQPAPPQQAGALALQDLVRFDMRTQWRIEPVLEQGWIVPRPVLDHPVLEAPVPFWGLRSVGDLGLLIQAKPMPVYALLDALRDRVGVQAACSLWASWWRLGIIRPAGLQAASAQDTAIACSE